MAAWTGLGQRQTACSATGWGCVQPPCVSAAVTDTQGMARQGQAGHHRQAGAGPQQGSQARPGMARQAGQPEQGITGRQGRDHSRAARQGQAGPGRARQGARPYVSARHSQGPAEPRPGRRGPRPTSRHTPLQVSPGACAAAHLLGADGSQPASRASSRVVIAPSVAAAGAAGGCGPRSRGRPSSFATRDSSAVRRPSSSAPPLVGSVPSARASSAATQSPVSVCRLAAAMARNRLIRAGSA
jgi:hypothetical protein